MSNNCDTKYNDQIHIVREKVLEHLETDPKFVDTVDDEDIANIKNYDWFIHRWLTHNNGNCDQSVQQMITTLQWRHKMGFRSLATNYFPNEFYRIGGMFFYEPTQDGQFTFYLRLCRIRKMPEMNEVIKKLVSYNLWLLEKRAGDRGFVIVFDLNGASLTNCDLEIARHLISTIVKYFLHAIVSVYIVDFPIILWAFWALIKNLIPSSSRSSLKFCSRDDLLNYIDSDRLPIVLGGSCERLTTGWKLAPPGSPSCYDFGVNILGISPEKCEKMCQIFIPYLDSNDSENLNSV